jgi:hypothetical protein
VSRAFHFSSAPASTTPPEAAGQVRRFHSTELALSVAAQGENAPSQVEKNAVSVDDDPQQIAEFQDRIVKQSSPLERGVRLEPRATGKRPA